MNKDDTNRGPTGAGAGVADRAPGKAGGRKYPLKDRIYGMQQFAIKSMEENAQPGQAEFMADVRESARKMNAVFDDVERLQPYLERAIKKDPKYAGRTYREIFDGFPTYALQLYISKTPAETVAGIKSNPILFKGFDAEELDTIVDFIRLLENARKAEKRAEQRRRKKAGEVLAVENSVLEKEYLPMSHGPITDLLALFTSSDADTDRNGTAVIAASSGDWTIKILDAKNSLLNVNTHKLLCVAVSEFTKNNHFSRARGEKQLHYDVHIPFMEFARQCNYKVDEKPTKSPAAAEKEHKRAQDQIKNAKKFIRRDCHTLRGTYIKFEHKKGAGFTELNVFEGASISGGYIHIIFGRMTAQELSHLPIMQYKRTLLGISGRDRTAYGIAYKMSMHYNNDNNIVRGSNTRLKVETLLGVANLPEYEYLQATKNARHWTDRIREPFEKALEKITGTVLSEWYYVKAKGALLTDEELESITSYEVFSSLYVEFKLIGEPEGQAERLERRAAEKAKAAEKAAQKTKQKDK